MIELDDRPAQPAAGETDFYRTAVKVHLLRADFLIALDPGPLLRGPGLCAAAQPFELIAQEILAFQLTGLLPLDTGRLLLEEIGIIARIGMA